ncbi:hypothetical protein MKK75_17590 [Methylobacterium sp. J-030]|uniref:hypothetical protein n=1 Tax=Methylobacterium sp. J-030 TaxID=2836627 RepID=UPI001FBB8F1E|nr:hypothetical protein [Methylobacterium sp. J-030]MCJ2070585.1 hypothetical protein [Methylobacterium sp. J-030]
MPECFPSLNEDLTAEPLHGEVQALLRSLIERGQDPAAVADAALSVATALNVDTAGAEKTSVMLLLVSEGLKQAGGGHAPSSPPATCH